jgi:hypothetical protein
MEAESNMTDEQKIQAEADLKIILEELLKYRIRYGFEGVGACSHYIKNCRCTATASVVGDSKISVDLWEETK